MITILGLLGALQGFILAGAILSLRGARQSPNRLIGLGLLILSTAVLTITGQHGGLFGDSIFPILVEYTATLLLPPVLWKYATTVLGAKRRVPWWIHFLPVSAWVAYLLAFTLGWTSWRWLPPILSLMIYGAAYTTAVALRVWSRRSEGRALVFHRRVLKALVLALMVIHIAQVIRFLFRDVPWLVDLVPLTATLLLCVFSVVAFRQSRLFAGYEPRSTRTKYATSTLTPQSAEEIQERLLGTMERDRPYLNENLTLADLAARLKVPRAHLSQVVNDKLGSNFPELLTQYRLVEAERLFTDPGKRHLTLEDIAYEVGFRSRSAFHSAFKGQRGITPGQARREMSQKTFGDILAKTEE
ncbi:MAG: AraC family transcriptional regulator [Acidobacteriota bacterium]